MKEFKPFNLERALAGDPVITREGKKIIELHYFKSALTFPLRGVIESENGIDGWTIEGKYRDDSEDSLDLFMAPKEKTYWFNIYRDVTCKNKMCSFWCYETEELAKNSILLDSPYWIHVKTISLTIED